MPIDLNKYPEQLHPLTILREQLERSDKATASLADLTAATPQMFRKEC